MFWWSGMDLLCFEARVRFSEIPALLEGTLTG